MTGRDDPHPGTAPEHRSAPVDAAWPLPPDDRVVLSALERTLAYARERDYTGWDYGDGMSSRLRRASPIQHKWLNVAFQEAVKRAPVNVRRLLLVEQRRNYQGTALFAMANQTVDHLLDGPGGADDASGATDGGATTAAPQGMDTSPGLPSGMVDSPTVDYAREARSLLEWLLENRSEGYAGYCGGYQHPIQHLDGRGDPGEPDVVNTSFGVRALLRGGEYDPVYPDVARSAADFVVGDLSFEPADDDTGAVIDYHTKHPQAYYTINAGALGARLFVDLYARFEEPELRERAEALLDHIATLQTDLGGWYYREPRDASHLSMDNHHNGFVIEAFQRYVEVVDDDRYDATLESALRFYRDVLFEDGGAPNFDETSSYPRDVHASTQGVLVFTYAGDLAFARQVLQWALENLHAGDGRFYFRKERLYTRRVTLMRWCQAWMAYAMAEYLDARVEADETL